MFSKSLMKIYLSNVCLFKILFSVKLFNLLFLFFIQYNKKTFKAIYIILVSFFNRFLSFFSVKYGSIELIRIYFRKKILIYLYDVIDTYPTFRILKHIKYFYLLNKVYSEKKVKKTKASNTYFKFIVLSTKVNTFKQNIKINLYFYYEIMKILNHQKNMINNYKKEIIINLITQKNLLLWNKALKLFLLEFKIKNNH